MASATPRGISFWPPAWQLVATANATFLAALSGWEADPTPSTLERTRRAYDGVLAAWHQAAAEYLAERQEAP